MAFKGLPIRVRRREGRLQRADSATSTAGPCVRDRPPTRPAPDPGEPEPPARVGRQTDRPVVFGLPALQEPHEAVEPHFRSRRPLAERARRLPQKGRIRPAETSDGSRCRNRPSPSPRDAQVQRRDGSIIRTRASHRLALTPLATVSSNAPSSPAAARSVAWRAALTASTSRRVIWRSIGAFRSSGSGNNAGIGGGTIGVSNVTTKLPWSVCATRRRARRPRGRAARWPRPERRRFGGGGGPARGRHCEQWPTSMSKRRTMGCTGGRSS